MAETQTNTAPVSGAEASSASASSENTGSDSTQPTNGAVVESTNVEANRNSGSSDGDNGGDAVEGERQRPARSERRISELANKVRELEQERNQQNQLIQRLNQTPIDASKVVLPDYSQMDAVYPQQIKEDIIKAASQIVDMKMATSASVIDQNVTQRAAAQQALSDIDRAKSQFKVLDEGDDDNYDENLAKEINDGWFEMFQINPNYRYSDHLRKFNSVLKQAGTSSKGAGEVGAKARGTQANRSSAGSHQTVKFEDLRTADEMKTWIQTHQGR